MGKVIIPFLILTASSIITCCSVQKIPAKGPCAYRIECMQTMKPVNLDNECERSSNYNVIIDLKLLNVTEQFHIDQNKNFLETITTLTVYGNFTETKLSFLENMYRLRNLNVIYSNIQSVEAGALSSHYNLETINFSRNRLKHIEDVFVFEKRPYKLRKISLAYNDIEEIVEYTFEELESLLELDLSHNLIGNLNKKLFNNLTNLEVLKLNHNQIKYLNGAMDRLYNLKHLYISHNQIKNVDLESLKTISHLQTLDISENRLQDLNVILFSRHWEHYYNNFVCKIILSKNYITKIPNTMLDKDQNASKIIITTELVLSSNSIMAIEYNAFQSIEHLMSLDLSNNRLSTFYVNPDSLSSVKYLNLSCNLLRTLEYRSFYFMHSLENLDLSHNTFDFFPDQYLINNRELKHVNVTQNDIRKLYNLRITFHPNGGVLDLSANNLSILNIPGNEAVGLTELILKSNNINDTYLIQLQNAPNLIKLDMSDNYIPNLNEHSLQLPKTLGYLDLSYNEIQLIGPSSFHSLPHLRTLRLKHNRLQKLDHGVFNSLTTLTDLDLSFNQIGLLDSKVFMDLKHLSVLSLRYNSMNILVDDSWVHHEQNLIIYLDGNYLTCDWLAKVLNNHENGYSKVIPAVLEPIVGKHSIDGIPCTQDAQNFEKTPNYIMDERLLKITQKILEEIQNQTSYFKKYVWRSILLDGEKKETENEINRIVI